ncbi:cadherin domain-containing protein [Phormidium tenue FACHB-886]|nr:cadherin domain-containing protein [Phormidium tenue FACHB-886]
MPLTPVASELLINTYITGEQNTASIPDTTTERRSTRAVAMAPTGEFIVTWASVGQGGDTPLRGGIYAQRYSKDGTKVGDEFRVDVTDGVNQRAPSIAVDGSGNFVITWSAFNSETLSFEIYTKRYNSSGNILNEEFLVNTPLNSVPEGSIAGTGTFDNQQNSSIAMNAAGDFVVVWESQNQDGDGYGIYAKRFSANGQPKENAFKVNTTSLRDQQNGAVAIATDGSFVVVWESNGQDGSGWGIFAQRYGIDGKPIGAEFQVNPADVGAANDQRKPSVAMDATTGDFVVTWTSDDGSGTAKNKEVYFRQFTANGAPKGGQIRANQNPIENQQYSVVTALPGGGFAITWSGLSGEGGGSGSGVFLRRFKADGSPIEEADISVNTTKANDQLFSSIAADAAGNLAVVWTGREVETTVNNVYGQLYATDTGVNQPPTDLKLTPGNIAENAGANAEVGTFTTTDPNDTDTFTYVITGGADAAAFTVAGNKLLLNQSADFETKRSYEIQVRTIDRGGLFFDKLLIVGITDVNEPSTGVTLSNTLIAEGLAPNTEIGELKTVDPDTDDLFNYELVSGFGDNALFNIQGGNKLVILQSPDYETDTDKQYLIKVRSTDKANNIIEQELTLQIQDVNENPTDITIDKAEVAENLLTGSTVGKFSTVDPDGGTFTYTLLENPGYPGNAQFAIDNTTGELKTAATFDFEAQPSYKILVQSQDDKGLTLVKEFQINVGDVNEQPTAIAIQPATPVDENFPADTIFAALQTADPDRADTHSYAFVAGAGDTDNNKFNLNPTTGALSFKVAPNFETQSSYTIRVESTDSGVGNLKFVQAIAIPINDLDEIPDNAAPTDIGLTPNLINENAGDNAVVGTLTTADTNVGDQHTYQLVTDQVNYPDNDLFTIEGSPAEGYRLRLKSSADYETKQSYKIKVRTRDAGGLTFDKELTVGVNDINEGATDIGLNQLTIPENVPANTAIAKLTGNDPDTGDTGKLTYTLVDGADASDNAKFTIVGDQLVITESPDFERKDKYQIRIKVTDDDTPALGIEKAIELSVTDLNEAPTDLALAPNTVNENVPAGTVVGTINATDPDAGDQGVNADFKYTLVAGGGDADNNLFTLIEKTGQLLVNTPPDYEKKRNYSIRVRVADKGGLPFEKVLAVGVIDDPTDPPNPTEIALTNNKVSENGAANFEVGTLSTIGLDGTGFTYELVAGTNDNARFAISGDKLILLNPANFEAQSSYLVQISSRNATGSTTKNLTINVVNVNEQSTDIVLSASELNENVPANSLVGSFTTIDPDTVVDPTNDAFGYTLVEGFGDNAAFTIVNNELRIKNSPSFEQLPGGIYRISVVSTDSSGLTVIKEFNITLKDLAERPTDIQLTSGTIEENKPVGTVVGALITTDDDANETQIYSLVEGFGDNGKFSIGGEKLDQLLINEIANYEAKTSYQVKIRVTDKNGLTFDKEFSIAVTDLRETAGTTAPQDLQLSGTNVDENKPVGTLVGTFSTVDPDSGESFTYTLVNGAGSTDNALFSISGALGDELQINFVPNYEQLPLKTEYSIRARTTDKGGKFLDKVFVIKVNDLPERPGETAPQDLLLSNNTIAENNLENAIVGTFTTSDPDQGDTFTYSLVAGGNSEDNGAFTLDAITGELRLTGVADYETKQEYLIRVRTTDSSNTLFFEKNFKIGIGDLPENPGDTAPLDIRLSATQINENQPAGTAIGTLSTVDPDARDTFTYTLVNGFGDNAAFLIGGAQSDQLLINAIPDFEKKNEYLVRIRTTDFGGKATEKTFTIRVNDLPEAPGLNPPQDLKLDKTDILENSPPNTAIGTFATEDPDPGDSFTYTLVSGAGDSDNGLFSIVGVNANQLRLVPSPNYETKPSYSIRVRTTDEGGKFFEKAFTISVGDLPERPGDTAPTDLLLSNSLVDEIAPLNTVIGRLSTIDPDQGDSHRYQLATNTGDNAAFTIVGDELRLAAPLDFETKSTYTIQVVSTDVGNKSFSKTLTITVRDQNDAPILTATAGAVSYTEGSGAVPIDPSLQAVDRDSANLTGATVSLAGYISGQDVLSFQDQGNIKGSFNAATGELTLTGTATVAEYQTALRSIAYTNTSPNPSTASRTIRFTVTDGTLTSNIATRTVQITATNTAPVVATSPGVLAYTENSGAAPIDLGIQVNDADSPNLTSATIALENYVRDQDVLSFTQPNGITGSFDSATGILTITGAASLATYRTALQSVTYTNKSASPNTTPRTVRFSVTDDTLTSNVASRTIQIATVNSAPTIVTSAGSLSFIENGTAVGIDPGITVGDIDSTLLTGATVTLVNYDKAQDILSVANQGAISGSFDAETGILTLTGAASVEAYQTVLRSITYSNSSDNPSTAPRTVRFTVTDGTAISNPETRTIQVTPSNDAPIAKASVASIDFPRATGAVAIDSNLTISDVDSPNLSGATVTLGGYDPTQDTLLFNGQNGITGNFSNAGVLTLTGAASVAAYQTALRSILYTNTSSNAIIPPRNVQISVTDGAATSAPAAVQIRFNVTETTPNLDLNGSGFGKDFSNTFVIAGVPVAVTATNARLADSDSATLTSAQVVITNLFDGRNEELLVDTVGTGITAFYNLNKGSLSLTGSASPETYLNVLRSIRYQNRSLTPDRTTRIVLFSVSDGSSNSEPAQTAVQITQVNLSNNLPAQPQSLATTPATDLLNAPGGDDMLTSPLAYLQQNDQVDGGGGLDTFLLSDGSGEALVDVRNPVNQVRGIMAGKTAVTNFEYFDFSRFSGNVTIQGSDTLDDRLSGGSGDDSLSGAVGNDQLIGHDGSDRLDGGAGDDTMTGGSGSDTYWVDSAGDVVVETGDTGFDTVVASVSWAMGNEVEDLLLGRGAIAGTGNSLNNTITGNDVSNSLTGGAGNDVLLGSRGNDTLVGGSDNDTMTGGSGKDRLIGGSGNDRLTGEVGKDRLTGGKGKDRFCFSKAQKNNADTITDFRAADDTICISRKGFSKALNRGRISADRFVLGSQAENSDNRFIYEQAKGALFYDADGTGGTAQVQIAQLKNGTALTRADIYIIK